MGTRTLMKYLWPLTVSDPRRTWVLLGFPSSYAERVKYLQLVVTLYIFSFLFFSFLD